MTDEQDRADIKSLCGKIDNLTLRFEKIEPLLIAAAEQRIELNNAINQQNTLWAKYDKLTGPGGTIEHLNMKQASCPRDEVKEMGKKLDALRVRFYIGIGFANAVAIFLPLYLKYVA